MWQSCVIAIALLALGPGIGSAQEGDSGTIEVLTERSPFTEPDASSGGRGEATIYVRELLREAGLAEEIRFLPWKRAFRYVIESPNVMLYPVARTAQREEQFIWIGQLIPVRYYLFKLRSREDIEINSIEAARNYKIGVVNFHVHHEYLDSQGFTALQPVNQLVQNLRKAQLGRIDLFPVSDGGLIPICQQYAIDCSLFEPVLELSAISGGLYLAMSPDTSPDLLERSRRAYDSLRASGAQTRIFEDRLMQIERFHKAWPTLPRH